MGRLLGGSVVGLMATSSKRAYATHHSSQVCCSQNTCPPGRSLLTHASTGDNQTDRQMQAWLSLLWESRLLSLSPGAHKVLSVPFKCLWYVCDFILNAIVPLLLIC